MQRRLDGSITVESPFSVLYGRGCTRRLIGGELRGARRALLVTSRSVAPSTAGQLARDALGSALAAVFDGVVPHLPRPVVFELVDAYRSAGADAVVTLGGGSTTDAGKALRLALGLGLREGTDLDALPEEGGPADVPHIAIPTTLSGSEFSALVAVTDPITRRKQPLRRRGLTPTATFLDAEAVASTPPELWAAGALKVFSDTMEVLTATDLSPLLEPLALQALGWLSDAVLSGTLHEPDTRLRTQLASWSSVFTIVQSGSRLGVATALRHVAAPAIGAPHGAFSAILLSHVYRFTSADVPDERHRRIAAALDLPDGRDPAGRIAGHLDELVLAADVPLSLRAYGDPSVIDSLVSDVLRESRASSTFRRDLSEDAIRDLLSAAF